MVLVGGRAIGFRNESKIFDPSILNAIRERVSVNRHVTVGRLFQRISKWRVDRDLVTVDCRDRSIKTQIPSSGFPRVLNRVSENVFEPSLTAASVDHDVVAHSKAVSALNIKARRSDRDQIVRNVEGGVCDAVPEWSRVVTNHL